MTSVSYMKTPSIVHPRCRKDSADAVDSISRTQGAHLRAQLCWRPRSVLPFVAFLLQHQLHSLPLQPAQRQASYIAPC